MDKYLQEILLEMNMIIIPGLGALSMVNRATGEIMFMSYLKHDDHVLAKHIAAKEGWEENDALNLISKYVREIEAKLNVGESYDMYRFGSFKKDSSGDVAFESWHEENSSNEEVPASEPEEVFVEQLVSEPIIEKVGEPVIESVKEIIPEPVILQEESAEVVEEEEQAILSVESDSIEVIEPLKIIDKAEESTPVVIPIITPDIEKESIIQKVEEKTVHYSEEDQWKDDLDLPPINAKVEHPKKPIIEKTKSDKKKRKPAFYILTVLLVLLIGGSLAVAVFFDQVKQHLPFVAKEVSKELKATPKSQEKLVLKEEKAEEDPILEEETIVEEIPSNEKPTEEVNNSGYIQTSTGRVNRSQPFHLIAGAFREQSNAERFKERLRENGNANSEIIGQFDQLFVVSVGSYSSKAEAQQDYQMKKANYPKAWVFQWP